MASSSVDFRYLPIAIDIVSARLSCTKAEALEWLVTALANEAAASKRRAMAALIARSDEARARALDIARGGKYGPDAGDLFQIVLLRFWKRSHDVAGPFTDDEFNHGFAILLRSMRNARLDEVDRLARLAPEQEPPAGGGQSGESRNPVFQAAQIAEVSRLLPRFWETLLRSLTRAEAETLAAIEESAQCFDSSGSPFETWVFCDDFLDHKRGADSPHAQVKANLVARLHQLPNCIDQRVSRLKMKWHRAQEEVFS